jgi:hypothetical protein
VFGRRAVAGRQPSAAGVLAQPVALHHQALGALRDFQASLDPVLAHQRIERDHVHITPGQRKGRRFLKGRRTAVEDVVRLRPAVPPSWVARPAVRHVEQLHHAGPVRDQRVDEHAEDIAGRVVFHAPQGRIGPLLALGGASASRSQTPHEHSDHLAGYGTLILINRS